MKGRRLALSYAALLTILLCGGFVLAFYFAWQSGARASVFCIFGIMLGFIFAPIVHEFGHMAMASCGKMDCVYAKFFCFKIYVKKGKKRFGFASPLAADQTQVVPKMGGNMKKRALLYTAGGLITSGLFLLCLVCVALALTLLGKTNYLWWGAVPYPAYLFFLNVLPFEYASGKTDALVYRGIKKEEDAEKTMLAAMEIQGRLYAGETFAQMDEKLYFELPQLREDEPLYAVILDLRYRYYLEKEDMQGAAECLNRLITAQEYLSDTELEKLAGELVYMHSVLGNVEKAEERSKACREYLVGDSAAAKRILAAFSFAAGKTEAIEPLIAQAREALEYERISGLKKWEEILLSRISEK